MSANAGTIVRSFSAPDANVRGIACDWKYFYFSGNTGNAIYITDLNGVLVDSFSSPGSFPDDLEVDEKYIYVTDTSTDLLYTLDKSGNVITSFDAVDTIAMASDGDKFYSVATGGLAVTAFSKSGVNLGSAGTFVTSVASMTFGPDGTLYGLSFNQGDVFVNKMVDGKVSTGDYEITVLNSAAKGTSIAVSCNAIWIAANDGNIYQAMI